jgi:sulfite reductase (NADPH) flavoprotein alpha-component
MPDTGLRTRRAVPVLPPSAPFTTEQRAWLNGFLAGLFAGEEEQPVDQVQSSGPLEPLLVLYGSQTGTAERLARQVAGEAAQQGFAAKAVEMNACQAEELKQHSRLLVVTSTWGDGDPPDNAVTFWQLLNSAAAPRLDGAKFAVFGLGDRNYSDFCGAAKKFDARLEQLGASRIHARIDCDSDYEAQLMSWSQNVWPVLKNGHVARAAVATVLSAPKARAKKPTTVSAQLLCSRNLNGPGSAKETRHVEISLANAGIEYEVGDALGVMPCNCPELMSHILTALGCDGEEAVADPYGEETSLRNALLTQYDISRISNSLFEATANRSHDAALARLRDPSNKAERDEFVRDREIIDLLESFPQARFRAAEFVQLLAPLKPRLYSIASSPKAHPSEVHLTVGVVRYQAHGRDRKGVCSSFLADRVRGGCELRVFVQPSHGFRLPAETDGRIIMVGPGTGIAPFRAFLEERQVTGARGPNWLLFGDQHAASDFLYREQLETMLASKHLTRLDTAFSRDQAEKLYVQHRMLENAKDLFAWLEDGAHFYVCGDAKRMAKDVDAALHQVIQTGGRKTLDQATEYVAKLKAKKRYQRDVY